MQRIFTIDQLIKDMIKITLPDGAVKEYESGITALAIAKSISEGLARKVLAASINGQTWDATRPINEDAQLKLLTWDEIGRASCRERVYSSV